MTIEKCAEKRWLVVKTKSRCEKKLATYCCHRNLVSYLPLRRSIRRYKYRTVEFLVPMFSGYVFAQIDPNDRLLILESSHAAQLIVPDDSMEEILIGELKSIQQLMRASEDGEILVRSEIQIGKTVTIKGGALSGLNGIVTRRQNKTRITINVDMIGYSVSVDLDVGEVEIEN